MKKPFKEWLIDTIDNVIEKINFLKICLQKTRIRDNREKFSKLRIIYLNNKKPDNYIGDEPLTYSKNTIKTSKYTLINFLPKNLFEQFRRIANFYFLINCIILFIIPDPPSNPYANALPFVIVIAITAIKQAYEDIIRHKSDWEVNSKVVKVLRNNKFEAIKCKDIKVGDIVEVLIDQSFPCDLLLLYSKSEDGTCYVKTSNLDGETNLKLRSTPPKFVGFNNEEELFNVSGVVTCEKPNAKLYEFKGRLLYNNKEYPISNENILLRGSHLKIAPVIYGCAIYTGQDTKMMINSKFKSNKLSCIEKKLNYYVLSFLAVLILLSIGCLIGSVLNDTIYNNHWYLFRREPSYFYSNRSFYYFVTFIYFMNLNYIIPLSLYVTLEIVRFIGSSYFEWDLKMYDEKTDQPAKVNSTDLNEDLGQIEYLFSDKTGTLTENEMVFKHFSIEGRTYEELEGNVFETNLHFADELENGKLKRFFEGLSVCHTVQIDQTNVEKYNASSPDELSFIKFCAKLGISFEGDQLIRDENKIIRRIVYDNQYERTEKLYEILHILEFDSDRKRMSVILKDLQRNEYVLFCKGADSSVFKNSICKTERLYDPCLKSFSENGWRVLVLAYRTLDEAEYKRYADILNEASNDILNREAKLSEAYEQIEKKLRILGVTAVEDKLQEDVEQTLNELRKAGIKVWVLTGDKLETAINISDSCGHFSDTMTKIVLKELRDQKEIQENLNIIKETLLKNKGLEFALIIDGETLGNLTEAGLNNEFRDVSMKCSSVLCCRMSPSQKALIVKMIKTSKEKPMTCAIGDGANDVSMIQEAHVGLGIFGKEGRNAALSSDFCFAKFKFIKRALLVHGYLYYTRASLMVLYFFYKNLVFSICQFYYAFWNAFSSASVFTTLFLTFYNLALSSGPVLTFALFEQHKPIEKLEKNPYYYRTIARNKYLSTYEFIKWTLIGVWHSALSFFFSVAFFSDSAVFNNDGKAGDNVQLGALVLFLILIITHIKILLIWNEQNIQVPIAMISSVVTFAIVCLALNSFIIPYPFTLFTEDQAFYFIYFVLLSSGSVWLFVVMTTVLAIIPDLIIKTFEYLKEESKFRELERTLNRAHVKALQEHIRLSSRNVKASSSAVFSRERTNFISHINLRGPSAGRRVSSTFKSQISLQSTDNEIASVNV